MMELAGQLDIEIRFSDFGRARLNDLLVKCGYFQLANHKRQRLFQILARGCRLLASQGIQKAHDWEHCLRSLATASWPADSISMQSVNVHLADLTNLLIDQPSTSFEAAAQENVLAFGTKLFLCVSVNTTLLDTPLVHAVRQLFKSNHHSWSGARKANLIQLDASDLSVDTHTRSKVVKSFLESLTGLEGFDVPRLCDYLGEVTAGKSVASAEVQRAATEPAAESSSQTRKVKPPDDRSVNTDLFRAQILRSVHPDLCDGYRLPFNWGRLNTSEFATTMGKLRVQLRLTGVDNLATRIHSAARMTSLFCGLSLKACLGLPVQAPGGSRCRGTMHLNLTQGVLRRDVLCIANRTDRPDRRQVQGRWWRTHLPPEVISVLMDAWKACPSCKTLGDLLESVDLDHEKCQHLLNDGWPSSHRPEDTRFANSLTPLLIELGIHPALVARVTGDTNVTPPADHYYLSFDEHVVHDAVQRFCIWAQLTPPPRPPKNRVIGSPKALAGDQMKCLMGELNQMVLRARNFITTRSPIKDVIDFHNLYTSAVVLQIIWALGARGTRISRLTFERIFGSDDYIAISDRRVDRYSRQRICPSTPPLLSSRQNYLEHLRALAKRIHPHLPQEASELTRQATGLLPHRSPFHVFTATHSGWFRRELNRHDLTDLLIKLGENTGIRLTAEDLNASRHFWHTALVSRGVAQVAVESLLGHHIVGSEPFGFGSGVSVREVCDYLRPILTDLQDELEIRALVGLGRRSGRYLVLPELATPHNLRVLPSVLLKQKLSEQELVIPDLLIREQDPPSTSKTPLSHGAMRRLHSSYKNSKILPEYPCGAALFGLVCFDLTLSRPEQEALFLGGMTGGIWRIGEMCVVEAWHEDRPVGQRILADETQLAFFTAHRTTTPAQRGRLVFSRAIDELHLLLRHLDPHWPGKDAQSSLRLLSLLASHWAAIEISPGTLFGVFHKAPFIPAADLARLHFDRPRIIEKPLCNRPAPRRQRDEGFRAPMDIVRDWADKDRPLGESVTRGAGCAADLRQHLMLGNLDLSERLFTGLLVADLSDNPPYKKLDISTLSAYAQKYREFFKLVRNENCADLEPDDFLTAFKKMGGEGNIQESAAPRWALLHICAFLSQHGYWVPNALTESPATKVPRPARIPIYTSALEVRRAALDLSNEFDTAGGTYSFAPARMNLQRYLPLRHAEVRYLRPQDLDCAHGMLHITTSGHNHLKTEWSRGSIPIPAVLAPELESVKSRRTAIYSGVESLAFADAHLARPFAGFDKVSDSIRDSLVRRTGCPSLREHDLRAAAITDLCFDVEGEIDCIAGGAARLPSPAVLGANDLNLRFSRFALASRHARHASVLTTLRYYNCSGMLDLHSQVKRALVNRLPSGIHVAALLNVSEQSVYASNHRARKAHGNESTDASVLKQKLEAFRLNCLDKFPTPPLQGPVAGTGPARDLTPRQGSARRFYHACLLTCTGLTAKAAADALQIDELPVSTAICRAQQFLSAHGAGHLTKDTHSMLRSQLMGSSDKSSLEIFIDSFTLWLSHIPPVLNATALPLGLSIRASASTLNVSTADHLQALLPLLSSLSPLGVRVAFRAARGVLVSQHPGLGKQLEDASVTLHPSRSRVAKFGLISFALPGATPIEKVSPRTIGTLGRIVLTGLLVSLHS